FVRSRTLREILAWLRTQAEYVVIEAPPTATSSDAQSLANAADAAIVAVELHRTTRIDLLDAAEQLERVRNAVLGCVVLPRLDPRAGKRSAAGPARRLTVATLPGGGYLAAPPADNRRTDPIPVLEPAHAARPAGWPRRDDRAAGTAHRPPAVGSGP